jgi:hypothetical protein
MAEIPRSLPLASLLAEAWRSYRSRCLWNVRPDADPRSIAHALKHSGDLGSFKLGAQIETLLDDQ